MIFVFKYIQESKIWAIEKARLASNNLEDRLCFVSKSPQKKLLIHKSKKKKVSKFDSAILI